ncbi:amino acid transporter [Candidatus Bathyarchaeota archaeon RBG_16_48_13]|nr:MAG: amino acid transporter [Candidatus Bathyarchaeota archaeon RBG_16_48_13]
MELHSKLTLFDVTNLVVGAIIGADIYVASSFGAGYLGPFSLIVWVIAGIIAIVIALCFAQCVALLPKVGGPYVYSKEAWGPFAGFLVGWSLWLAEWISLAVFPIAFTRYLMFFLPYLDWFSQILVKAIFVCLLMVSNIVGAKAAGRTNDVLTLAKLAPLIFFSIVGLISMGLNVSATVGNFSPFVPLGLGSFGPALVLIFWAYAGFEISTIPAGEIENPGVTIPKAIVLGISIVTVFYLLTNFVLFGLRPWNLLVADVAPLATATSVALGSIPTLALIGGAIVGAGALVSVAGSDESGMIGTSRLGYALAADGLFPRSFAKIHSRFKTPYMAIIIQSVSALAAAIVGNLSLLIATSVFLMAISYLATSAAIFPLRRKNVKAQFSVRGGRLIPVLGALFSLYLISQCTIDQIALGLVAFAIGIPVYSFFSPKKEIRELRDALSSREDILRRTYQQEERFLAHLLRHVKRIYRRISGKKQAWDASR